MHNQFGSMDSTIRMRIAASPALWCESAVHVVAMCICLAIVKAQPQGMAVKPLYSQMRF